MTEPINLNKVRKARAKATNAERAAENRIKHGRTKAERELEKARAAKLRQAADAHKLTDD